MTETAATEAITAATEIETTIAKIAALDTTFFPDTTAGAYEDELFMRDRQLATAAAAREAVAAFQAGTITKPELRKAAFRATSTAGGVRMTWASIDAAIATGQVVVK